MPRTPPVSSDDSALEFIRLLWKVDHELHSVSKRMISRFGLTAPQRLAVRFIGREPGLKGPAEAVGDEARHWHAKCA